MTDRYNPKIAEPHWQEQWAAQNVFVAPKEKPAKPYYVLEMFPYPSGKIHMGHVRNYTLGDVVARFRKAQGYDVLHPMGWDAFGLPAENAAIQSKVHPAAWTYKNIKDMREQLKPMGLSYDWSREIATCSPDYYRFEQEFFLAFLEKGLAYRKESWVNWDPVEHTVLANEQVIDGKGWRSGAVVEKKQLAQWFLKITDYAEELLQGLDTLSNWPEKVRLMQERWIGKSHGAVVEFKLTTQAETIPVFTTRPDTLFGAAFVAISPSHPLSVACAKTDLKLAEFLKECNAQGTSEAAIEQQEKKGYKTPLTVQHPFVENAELPVYVANFVLMEYGTGAVFGCPAHDQRDNDFARKYGLPITPVVLPTGESPDTFSIATEAYTGDGTLYNSDFLNGLSVADAKKTAAEWLAANKQGEAKTTYRLRDWLISRQRYWGCPIPIIYCDSCGIVPVPKAQLPVTLPEDIELGQAGNPLDRHPTWKHINCPTCNKPATRETDTFDTFFESSWYFARFTGLNPDKPFDRELAEAWLSVDQYIGGVEHAVLHLLYARFFTKALRDVGYWRLSEPFKGLMTQGMICHQTFKNSAGQWLFPEQVADGVEIATGNPVTVGASEKMSKSLKNVVDPDYIISTYGADTARLFMLSDCPPERDMDWTDAGVEGAWRYTNRLWKLVHGAIPALPPVGTRVTDTTQYTDVLRLIHSTIHHVTQDISQFRMNRGVARIRELSNGLEGFNASDSGGLTVFRFGLETLCQLIAPMMPHLAEELWRLLGHKTLVIQTPWPVADEKLMAKEVVTIAVQINGKLRATLDVAPDFPQSALEQQALAAPTVIKALEGKTVRKIIVVPNKIVNVVAA
jgi:leucyl-tRNA synthetase